MTSVCEGCGNDFDAKTSRARFCSVTCRSRAARAEKAAEANAKDESKTDTPAEHGLVKAVRTELEQAKKDQTFSGQLAIQLARRLANPDESGSTALSKELRAVMAEALATETPAKGAEVADSDGAAEEEDEVTRARRERAEARKAAGLA